MEDYNAKEKMEKDNGINPPKSFLKHSEYEADIGKKENKDDILLNNDINTIKKYNNMHTLELEQPNTVNTSLTNEDFYFDKIISSSFEIGKASVKIGAEFMILMLSNALKDFLVFIFCRTKGFEIVEAVTSLSVIYDMFCISFPWSLTCLYMYNAAEAYANGNSRLLGILTNKMNFILLVFGVTMALLFCTMIEPIFDSISNEPLAVNNLKKMMRWMSIGTPFFYLQMCSTRYLGTIEKGYIVSISSLITVGIQVIFLIIFVDVLDLVNFGVGFGFSIGFISGFVLQLLYTCIMKPHPESMINIFEGIFDNLFEFTCNVVVVGLTVFINYLTLDFIPFLALIIGDRDYTVMNIFIILIISFSLISESLNVGNNIIISYVIGKKKYEYVRKVYLVNLLISILYSLIVGGLLLGFLYYVLLMFIKDDNFASEAAEYRVLFFFSIVFANLHNINSETVLACGGENVGLANIIIGRLLISFFTSIMLIHITGNAVSSLLIGFIIGQIITLCLNIGYLINLFKDNNKQLHINMLKISTKYDALLEREKRN